MGAFFCAFLGNGIAMWNHVKKFFIFYFIYKHGIPVSFIHMIARNYTFYCISKKFRTHRLAFKVRAKFAVPFKKHCKNLSVWLMPHYRPVRIVLKRIILITILIREAVIYKLLFCQNNHLLFIVFLKFLLVLL